MKTLVGAGQVGQMLVKWETSLPICLTPVLPHRRASQPGDKFSVAHPRLPRLSRPYKTIQFYKGKVRI
ncbi:MAG: hypothetical protein KA314_21620 [Chloroflexi bacterium]|nr:hypothetical protein [Chloroflexota bacterium]